MRIRWLPLRILFSRVLFKAATTDHAKYALSVVRTLITAHFIAIFRDILIWHPARMGFSLFTLIIKFNIRDNAHPLSHSWNSLSDVNMGSITCCSYHSRKSMYRYISMFLVFILLMSRLLSTLEHYFSRVFQKPLRLSVIHWPPHRSKRDSWNQTDHACCIYS